MEYVQELEMRPVSRSDVSEELLDQELFLYDEATGTVHQLNSGAAMVWYLCDGTRDLKGIAEEIALASDVPAQDVMAEVQKTVAEFQALGLLE